MKNSALNNIVPDYLGIEGKKIFLALLGIGVKTVYLLISISVKMLSISRVFGLITIDSLFLMTLTLATIDLKALNDRTTTLAEVSSKSPLIETPLTNPITTASDRTQTPSEPPLATTISTKAKSITRERKEK